MDVETAMAALKDAQTGTGALEILHAASYFASADIRPGMFLALIGDPAELKVALDLLERRSFVQSSDGGTRIRVEKTIQTRVRKLLRERDQEEATLKLALGVVSKSLTPAVPDNFDHAMSVFAFAKEYPNLMWEFSSFPKCVVHGLIRSDRDAEASSFGCEALNVLEASVGPYHPSTLALRTNVGHSLVNEGKFEEALKILSEVYEKESEVSGRRGITKTLFWIAKSMMSSTVIPDPEVRLRQLVFGKVPVSETNNNSILSRWSDYALLLADLNCSSEALQVLRQVLKRRHKLLSPDDDDICEVKENIARVYLKQGNFPKALGDFQKVYNKRKTDLGENSIKTLLTREGMAEAFYSQGTYDKALTEYEEIAKKYREVLGEASPSYLSVRDMIANILFLQNEYEKSYEICTEIYEKHSVVFGGKNLYSLCVKHNIGSLLLVQNKTHEAMRIWEEVLEGFFEVLGPQHSITKELVIKFLSIKLMSDL